MLDKKEIIEIAKKIDKIGGRLYIVGGAVRDSMLGKEIKDIDFCVCGVTKEVFLDNFPHAIVCGKSFPVFLVQGCEFALARTEKKTGKRHADFSFFADPSVSIEEDLQRRDITINAMAYDILSSSVIDPYGGRKDLEEKKIRMVSTAFLEDPNRVYRVARFASVYGFSVESETLLAMQSMREDLVYVPAEVVFAEMVKAFAGEKPSIFLDVLLEAKVLDVHFSEVANLVGVVQPEKYHPEGDAYNHTKKVMDIARERTDNPVTIYACLCHDLGKASTKKEMLPRHIGHEIEGEKLSRILSSRLKAPRIYRRYAAWIARNHMRFARYLDMQVGKKIDVLDSLERNQMSARETEIIINADNAMLNTDTFAREYIPFTKDIAEIYNMVDAKKIAEENKTLDHLQIKEKVRRERITLYKNIRLH